MEQKNRTDIGLHLTLVNGGSTRLMKSLSRCKSLEDTQGFLHLDKFYFMKHFKYSELKREIDAQFEKLKNDGIFISHVDTHRYSIYPTYNPFAFLYLLKKCKEYNVPTRWCGKGNYFINNNIPNLCDSTPAAIFFSAIIDLYGIDIPDYVYKFPYSNIFPNYDDKKEAFINLLENLPPGINEVHIHPAKDSEYLHQITETYQERIYEYELMLDKDISQKIDDLGIELISYSDIKNLKDRNSRLKAIYTIFSIVSRYFYKKIKILL